MYSYYSDGEDIARISILMTLQGHVRPASERLTWYRPSFIRASRVDKSPRMTEIALIGPVESTMLEAANPIFNKRYWCPVLVVTRATITKALLQPLNYRKRYLNGGVFIYSIDQLSLAGVLNL